MNSSIYVKKYTLPKTGGLVGPLEVPIDNGIYKIEISQSLEANNWTYIFVEILNEQQETIASIGDEFWDERGVEGGTAWHESDREFTAKMVFDKKGKYFFDVETEAGTASKAFSISFKIAKAKGSGVGFTWLFFVFLVVGIILNEFNRQTISTALSKS